MGIPSNTLTEQHKQILEEFKAIIYPLITDLDMIDDNMLVQYLQANVWNKEDAKKQLIGTIEWRKKNAIDKIPTATKQNKLPLLIACRGYKYIQDNNVSVQPGLSDSAIRIANCVGGECFHKFDKEGHPILIDRTGYHNTKEMGNNITTLEMTNFQISANEFLNRVIMPEGSERAGKPIHSETIIFDCTNMSLWQFHMSAFTHLKAIAEIVQNYYPETLHRLFIVNAPSAFVVMFKVIKPWLNARTLEKIHVLGNNYQSILLKYIEPENLPDFLGGTCQCQHMPGGCVPMISKDKLVPTEQNEHVPTVYNSTIMKAAFSDPSLCSI
ncbi:CRAL-TRIO domain-containing protein [Gilbertella persicaria]|uniref:CRAL-TRIO domain-containing protein n=1 Tax=Gilbertella persicaria TaxID=101096 RepID=UPI00221FE663|nr:CRAL-TRIO domain-containing protein [Gilbertella persicaria]KAI8084267.1 CRAL-TRIO domain-containing protein [Gilbertella persicaria]